MTEGGAAARPGDEEQLTDVLVRVQASVVPTLTQRVDELLTAAVTVLGVDSVGVMLLDSTDRPRLISGSDEPVTALENAQIATGQGPGMDTLRTGATVAVDDIADRPEYARLWQQIVPEGLRAVVSSSITVGGDIVGNLNAALSDAHAWTQAQIRANDAYAGVVGVVLGATVRALEGSRKIDRLHAEIALSGPLEELDEDG